MGQTSQKWIPFFARGYVACQTRDEEKTISSAMKSSISTTLSFYGELHLGNKLDLMGCLEQHVKSSCDSRPETDVIIMDGVVVNVLRTGHWKIFGNCAADVFVPHIIKSNTRLSEYIVSGINTWQLSKGTDQRISIWDLANVAMLRCPAPCQRSGNSFPFAWMATRWNCSNFLMMH